jgi:UDPglucose 6-dehydrogenase
MGPANDFGAEQVMKPLVGYAGLTHLGLCSAIGAAVRGSAAIGYSENRALIDQIQSGRLPVVEPGLDQAFRDHRELLTFTDDASRLGQCELVYVAVDVPTDDTGASDLSAIQAILDKILPYLGPDTVLVVLSQVPPGFTRKIRFAPDRLYYQVETLIFGRALERVTQPERFIVGCADPLSPLPPAYAAFLAAFECPVLPMRYESAELAKIAINCFLVACVSTTNTLAEVCETIGADWTEIAPALRLDRRIGPYAYLSPGLGIAGGNLERDLATVRRLSPQASVIAAYQDHSRHMRDWALRILQRVVLEGVLQPRIGILGLAYKQDTHSTKNSPSLALIAELRGVHISVHDPVVPTAVVPNGVGAAAPEDVADQADAVVIMTPWAEYRTLDPKELRRRMRGQAIIDPYGVVDRTAVAAAGLDHYCIGRPALRSGRTEHT